MKKNKNMPMKDQEFWESFTENVEMIIGFEDACNQCSSFIFKYGILDITLVDIEKNKYSTNSLLLILIGYYEKGEEFEKCGKLLESNKSENKPSEEEISSFTEKAKWVLSYDVNCIVCEEVFSDFDAITFFSIEFYNTKKSLDYLDLMTKLINYFHENKDFAKCILLSQLREVVIADL